MSKDNVIVALGLAGALGVSSMAFMSAKKMKRFWVSLGLTAVFSVTLLPIVLLTEKEPIDFKVIATTPLATAVIFSPVLAGAVIASDE